MPRPTNLTTALILLDLLLWTASSVAVSPVELPLWEGVPPRSERVDQPEVYHAKENAGRPDRWLTGTSKPIVSVHLPPAEKATGAAVVLFPGGGYAGQAIDKEGHFVARWLNDRGVLGVVVPYRCGGTPHLHPVPLHDAQRAVQLVRAHATQWGIDPTKVGVMGFSAGGHLAATAATQWVPAKLEAEDPLHCFTSRPDFAILVYPVISMRDGVTHVGSRKNLLGKNADDTHGADLSADERVGPQTPPTFLVHTTDDQAVPVENSLRFYQACRAVDVPAEMHLYPTGGHGFGMWSGPDWAPAFEAWLVGRGLATRKE